jgi:hypothetical protein
MAYDFDPPAWMLKAGAVPTRTIDPVKTASPAPKPASGVKPTPVVPVPPVKPIPGRPAEKHDPPPPAQQLPTPHQQVAPPPLATVVAPPSSALPPAITQVIGPVAATPVSSGSPALNVPPIVDTWRQSIWDYIKRANAAVPSYYGKWWSADPSAVLFQAMVESGGRWGVVKEEGYWASKRRSFCSIGLFQINEQYASALYKLREGLLGADLSVEVPPPPSNWDGLTTYAKNVAGHDVHVSNWYGPLSARPGSALYGVINARQFGRFIGVYFLHSGDAVFLRNDISNLDAPTQTLLKTIKRNITAAANVTNIPELALLMRCYWWGGSLQSMATKSADIPYFQLCIPSWNSVSGYVARMKGSQ